MFGQFMEKVVGNPEKTNQIISQLNDMQSELSGDFDISEESDLGFAKVTAEEEDYGKICDCNKGFCKIFGAPRSLFINSKITRLIPSILHRQHQATFLGSLDLINSHFVRRDKLVLGVHSSGYLIPLQISVKRLISFGQNSICGCQFSQDINKTPTVHFALDIDGIIKGASNQVYHWFNHSTLSSRTIPIYSLIPALKDILIEEILKKPRLVKISLKREKLKQSKSNLYEYESQVQITESSNRRGIKSFQVEIYAEEIKFKRSDTIGYLLRLGFPEEKYEEVDSNYYARGRLFKFNPEINVYTLGINEQDFSEIDTLKTNLTKDKKTIFRPSEFDIEVEKSLCLFFSTISVLFPAHFSQAFQQKTQNKFTIILLNTQTRAKAMKYMIQYPRVKNIDTRLRLKLKKSRKSFYIKKIFNQFKQKALKKLQKN